MADPPSRSTDGRTASVGRRTPAWREPDRAHEVSLRRATDEDVGGVLELVRACVDHLRANGIEQWDDRYPDRSTIEADVRGREAFVASHETGLLGYVALGARQDPEYAAVPWAYAVGPIAVISRLMVNPAAQGRGFAQAVMGLVEEQARAVGCRAVRLDAFDGNPRALRLYGRLGYRASGTIRRRTGTFRCFERQLAPADAREHGADAREHGDDAREHGDDAREHGDDAPGAQPG